MRNLLAVSAGAALFLWPAFLNAYPIVFSDTGGFLEQALQPDGGWDKPWVYGPFLTPFHWRTTLWPAVGAQALLLSWFVFLLGAVLDRPKPGRHVLLCAGLAVLTAAPVFASTLMPDIMAPLVAIGLFLLASRRLSRIAFAAVLLVSALAIASHLAHLVIAAACIVVLGLGFRRWPWRPALPLALALCLLPAANLFWHGRFAVSPYGSVFALARLVGNGPAAVVIRRECPGAGWHVCAWADRLPTDSDAFLWSPDGPVWGDLRGPMLGPVRFAPEAAAIVRETLLAEPLAVLRGAVRDAAEQATLVRIGDTLTAEHLDIAVLPRLQAFFGREEAGRFLRGAQARGRLRAELEWLNPLHAAALAIGLAWCLATLVRGGRGGVLVLTVLAAVAANAVTTGALSHPHHRYGARIAWLLVLAPAAVSLAARRPWFLPPPPSGGGRSAG